MVFPRRFRCSLVALIVALIVPCASALANGIVRDSLGAVSSGRGGANLALDDNLSLIHDNPAGIAWSDDALRLQFSNDFLLTDVKYRDADSTDTSTDLFYLPQFALAAKVPGSPLSFGIGAFVPGGYGVRYKLNHGIFGRQTYRSDGKLLKIQPVLAYRINDRVSIGGGVGFAYSDAQFKLPHTFNESALAGQAAKVELDTSGYAVTANLGIQVKATDRLTIGASYITETLTKQSGTFNIDVSGSPLAGLFVDPDARYDADFRVRWPRSAGLGAAYRFDFGRLALEAVWFNWRSSFDEFTVNLSNGDNPEFDAIAGDTTPTEKIPLDWRDSYAVRVGYEHFIGDDTIARVGYIYNMNPIPNRKFTPILPGILEHSFAVGFGHNFGKWKADVAYQYAFGSEVEVAGSDLAGDDFADSSTRAQAHWVLVTLAAKF